MMTPCIATETEIEAEKDQSRVRVVFANQPRLMRELLSRFADRQRQLMPVGMATHTDQWIALVRETRADCIVLPLDSDGGVVSGTRKFIDACPEVSVLALSRDGRHLRDLRGGRVLQEVTLETFATLLRRASGA